MTQLATKSDNIAYVAELSGMSTSESYTSLYKHALAEETSFEGRRAFSCQPI